MQHRGLSRFVALTEIPRCEFLCVWCPTAHGPSNCAGYNLALFLVFRFPPYNLCDSFAIQSTWVARMPRDSEFICVNRECVNFANLFVLSLHHSLATPLQYSVNHWLHPKTICIASPMRQTGSIGAHEVWR